MGDSIDWEVASGACSAGCSSRSTESLTDTHTTQGNTIFRQFDDALNGREIFQPDLAEKKSVLLEFFEMVREEMPEMPALGKMKQLAGQFTKGLVGGAQFRQTLYHSHSATEILDNITTYFETLTTRQTFGDGMTEADKDLEIASCDAFSAQENTCSETEVSCNAATTV